MRRSAVIRNITVSTLYEELHHKSIYLFAALAVAFIFLLRGCFDGDVVVNGQKFDSGTVGWHASLIAFQLIAMAGVIVAILLGMKAFSRDRQTGTMASFLARPVHRIDYVLGKIVGIWLIAYGMTFLLHITVYIIMLMETGGRIVNFIPASAIIALNLLCITVTVVFIAQLIPATAAALITGMIWIVGYISDTIIMAANNEAVKNVLVQLQHSDHPVPLFCLLWPKITALQYCAVGCIDASTSAGTQLVHPAINVAFFTVVMFIGAWWMFRREEIR